MSTRNKTHQSIYKAYLRICNPLLIIDDGSSHTPEEIVYGLWSTDHNSVLSANGYKKIMSNRRNKSNILINILKRKGYDGFKYINGLEDVGSTSWVIFDSSQKWLIHNTKPMEVLSPSG